MAKRLRMKPSQVFKPTTKNNKVRKIVAKITAKTKVESEEDRLYATFSPSAMHSTVRTHLKSLRQTILGQDEATYRRIAARAAAYEVQHRLLDDDTVAAGEKATWRLNDLANDPSLAVLSPYHQRLGRGCEADQELLKLEGQKICYDRMLIICSNRRHLFQRGDLSEIKEFLATEVKEMKSTEEIYSDENLTTIKLRNLWPTCEDHWERLMRLQFVWVISMTANGMKTAAVDTEADDLLKDMEKLILDKPGEAETEEKHEKAVALMQDLLKDIKL